MLAYVNDGDCALESNFLAETSRANECTVCVSRDGHTSKGVTVYHMIYLEGKDAECSTRNDLG